MRLRPWDVKVCNKQSYRYVNCIGQTVSELPPVAVGMLCSWSQRRISHIQESISNKIVLTRPVFVAYRFYTERKSKKEKKVKYVGDKFIEHAKDCEPHALRKHCRHSQLLLITVPRSVAALHKFDSISNFVMSIASENEQTHPT